MIKYIINFGVYTMAMAGMLIAAVMVYKKSMTFNSGRKSNLKIDDKIALNARKSLYVVNAGGERFLIAGDMDNTSLIAKLGQNESAPFADTNPAPTTNPIKFADELLKQKEIKKPFISETDRQIKLKTFAKEFTTVQSDLNKAFNKVSGGTDKYLDIKNIRKKPVMKELVKKLAQL